MIIYSHDLQQKTNINIKNKTQKQGRKKKMIYFHKTNSKTHISFNEIFKLSAHFNT